MFWLESRMFICGVGNAGKRHFLKCSLIYLSMYFGLIELLFCVFQAYSSDQSTSWTKLILQSDAGNSACAAQAGFPELSLNSVMTQYELFAAAHLLKVRARV